MKIAILDAGAVSNRGDVSFAPIQALADVTLYDDTPKELVAGRIRDMDGVMINRVPLRRDVLSQAKNLEWIGAFSTGYNQIDLVAAKELGITVCNVPDYSTAAVAQMTFALLLELATQVGAFDAAVKNGVWQRDGVHAMWHRPMTELLGKTMGVIGFGSIGRAVARLADAFGMNTLAYSRTPTPGAVRFVSLDTLLAQSDVVSVHLPLSAETRGFLDARRIAQIKPGAFLLNTARGPIVDERALADALNTGALAGAALDVVSREPIDASNPLLTAKNCIITPHVAWAPIETRVRLISLAAQNLAAYLAKAPINVVNP